MAASSNPTNLTSFKDRIDDEAKAPFAVFVTYTLQEQNRTQTDRYGFYDENEAVDCYQEFLPRKKTPDQLKSFQKVWVITDVWIVKPMSFEAYKDAPCF